MSAEHLTPTRRQLREAHPRGSSVLPDIVGVALTSLGVVPPRAVVVRMTPERAATRLGALRDSIRGSNEHIIGAALGVPLDSVGPYNEELVAAAAARSQPDPRLERIGNLVGLLSFPADEVPAVAMTGPVTHPYAASAQPASHRPRHAKSV